MKECILCGHKWAGDGFCPECGTDPEISFPNKDQFEQWKQQAVQTWRQKEEARRKQEEELQWQEEARRKRVEELQRQTEARRKREEELQRQAEARRILQEEERRRRVAEQRQHRERAERIRRSMGSFAAAGLDFFALLREDGTLSLSDTAPIRLKLASEEWTDIVSVAAGDSHLLGLRSDGTVVSCSAKTELQCNVQQWKGIREIACAGKAALGVDSKGRLYLCDEHRSEITELTRGGLKQNMTRPVIALGTAGMAWVSADDLWHWAEFQRLTMAEQGLQPGDGLPMQAEGRLALGESPCATVQQGEIVVHPAADNPLPALLRDQVWDCTALYVSRTLCAALCGNTIHWAMRTTGQDLRCWGREVTQADRNQGYCTGQWDVKQMLGPEHTILNFTAYLNGQAFLLAVEHGTKFECWQYTSDAEKPERL